MKIFFKFLILISFLLLCINKINCLDGDGNPFRMIMLLSAGVNDLGFNNMMNQGRVGVAKDLNIEDSRLVIVDGLNETIALVEPILQNEDIDFIICSSQGHTAACKYFAQKYLNHPTIKTQFLIRGSGSTTANLIQFNYNFASANYMSGYFAGLYTKSKKIGFLSPGSMAKVNDSWVYAFWLGAKQINPSIEFYYYNIGAFLNPDASEAATNDLLDRGCDVIGNTLDDFSSGITIMSRGHRTIGTNGFPQKLIYGEKIIYSYAYNWTKLFLPITKSVKSGNTNNTNGYGDFNLDESKNFFNIEYSYGLDNLTLTKMNQQITYLKSNPRATHPYYCNDFLPAYAKKYNFTLSGVNKSCIDHSTFLKINEPFPGMTFLGIYNISLNEVKFSSSIQNGFSIVTGGLIAVTLIMMIGIIKFSKTSSIRSASPIFLNFILVGGIIVYIGIIVWVGPMSTSSCNARLWLVTLGFSTLIGSLVVKNFRIWLIFDNPELKSIKITNYQLFPWVGACLVINIILMSILTSVGDLKQIDAMNIDSLGKYEFMKVCKMNQAGASTLYTILAYFAALLLVGVFVSWKIRIVDIQEFNESGAIANTLYAISFCLFVIVPLMISPQDKQSETIILCTTGLFITTAALLIIFTPKFWRVFRKGSNESEINYGKKKSSSVATARAESGSKGSNSASGSKKTNRRGNIVSGDFTDDSESSIGNDEDKEIDNAANVTSGAVLAEFTDEASDIDNIELKDIEQHDQFEQSEQPNTTDIKSENN
ncbi:hypothetical protein RB653_006415 [Dictyostelium firmibasis]|uniref:G-protein coupled receptors family 3 profile domain-containing protein n=1 Tax=Dictyostelium firmibasis TaxID=79012 RepID=A0AAN7U8V9_9MYCE